MYADDDWRHDRYLDERDQWEAEHHADMLCEECGHTWSGGWSRGTLVDPPEPRYPDCPECNR